MTLNKQELDFEHVAIVKRAQRRTEIITSIVQAIVAQDYSMYAPAATDTQRMKMHIAFATKYADEILSQERMYIVKKKQEL